MSPKPVMPRGAAGQVDRMRTACLVALAMLGLVIATAMGPIQGPDRGTAAAEPGVTAGTLVEFHHVIVFQGDDPDTAEPEPRGHVQVIDRSLWLVPWDATELRVDLPKGASGVTLDHVTTVAHGGTTVFFPGRYSASQDPTHPPVTGVVADGADAGLTFWRFGSGVDRSTTTDLEPVDGAVNVSYDAELTDEGAWDLANGTLRLADGAATGTLTSPVALAEGTVHDVLTVELNWSGSLDGGAAVFEASADNGTTWTALVNGTEVAMGGTASALRWRATMSRDQATNATPVVDRLALAVRLVPEEEELWLEAEYTLTMGDGGLDFSLRFPHDGPMAGLVLLVYADDDVRVRVGGTAVVSSTLEEMPGKVVHRHMSGAFAPTLTFDLEPVEEGGAWLGVLFVLVLIAALAVAGVAYLRRGAGEGAAPEDEVEVDEGEEDEPEGEDAGEPDEGEGDGDAGDEGGDADEADAAPDDLLGLSVEELEAQKRRTLEAIKRVDRELEEGLIGADEHDAIRSAYKARAVRIIKALERKGQ